MSFAFKPGKHFSQTSAGTVGRASQRLTSFAPNSQPQCPPARSSTAAAVPAANWRRAPPQRHSTPTSFEPPSRMEARGSSRRRGPPPGWIVSPPSETGQHQNTSMTERMAQQQARQRNVMPRVCHSNRCRKLFLRTVATTQKTATTASKQKPTPTTQTRTAAPTNVAIVLQWSLSAAEPTKMVT